MGDNFFEISSPRDMLEKAKRELEKMKLELTTDTVFNFFVTAYHVMDYVKAQGKARKIEIDKMYADSDFEMGNFICNKGKHIQLKKGDPYKTKYKPGATLGRANLGEIEFGAAESYVIVEGTAYSTPKLPPIPGESCHRFHGNAATCSARKLPLIP